MLHARLEAHINVTLRFETALVEALKAEVLLGEGVAWLPESMIGAELDARTLRIVGDVSLTTPLTISLCRPVVPTADVHDPLGWIWSNAVAAA
jgi:LysR family transcriptional regulator, hypochlorite-specific transcription factor HypT